jgi:hypothetical protein
MVRSGKGLYRVSILDTGGSRMPCTAHPLPTLLRFRVLTQPLRGLGFFVLDSGFGDLLDVATDGVGGLVHVGDREGQRRRDRLVSGGPAWRDL